MTTHTPGPWHFDPQGGLPVIQIYCPDSKNPFHGHRSDEECAANARLMACSPELLDAAKKALTLIELCIDGDLEPSDEAESLRAAIAKATGTEI